MSEKQKILVSHIDLAGAGSVVLANFFQDRLGFSQIHMKNYGFLDDNTALREKLTSGVDEVVIADLTFPQEFAEKIKAVGTDLYIFDHHEETSWIRDYEGSVWDKSRCGTLIFWEEYVKPRVGRFRPIVSRFVELVDTYDLWKQDSEDWEEAKSLNSVFYGMRDQNGETEVDTAFPFLDFMCQKMRKLDSWRWTSRENKIIKRANDRESEMLKTARSNLQRRVDGRGLVFGLCRFSSKISIVAGKILEENPDLDYLVVINDFWKAKDLGKISVRTRREDFDLNTLREPQGHAKAAGAELTEPIAQKLWSGEIHSLEYES